MRRVNILRLVDNILWLLDLALLDILDWLRCILDLLWLHIADLLWLHILDWLGLHIADWLGLHIADLLWLHILDWLRLDVLNSLLHWLLDHRLLDHRLCDGWVGDHLGSLNWLIINELFDSLLGDHIDFNFLSDLGNIFGHVLNLLIIGVDSLDWYVVGLGDGLVFSDSSGDWYVFSSLLGNLFDVLSFIRNLDVADLGFVISVALLDGNVLNVGLGLGLWLLVDGGGGLDYLGLHDRLHQGVLNVLHWLRHQLSWLVDRYLRNGWLEDRVLRYVAWSHLLSIFYWILFKLFLYRKELSRAFFIYFIL